MTGRWVDAATIAERLGVSRDYVYSRADELGGRRLGAGPKARLRFRIEDVDAWLTRSTAPVPQPERPTRKRRGRTLSPVPLIPVKRAA